jgi:ABC-type multidrug transport system permease subunit
MTPRAEFVLVWSAIFAALLLLACGLANAIRWLAQQAFAAVYPWVEAHKESVFTAWVLALVVVLVVALTVERNRNSNRRRW